MGDHRRHGPLPRTMFFKSSKMSKLASEEDIFSQPDVHIVVIDRNKVNAAVGLTLANTTEGDGVLIYGVKPGSLAAHAGLRSGMVILTINEHKVGTHAEAVSLIDRASNGVSRLGLERTEGIPKTLHGTSSRGSIRAVEWRSVPTSSSSQNTLSRLCLQHIVAAWSLRRCQLLRKLCVLGSR